MRIAVIGAGYVGLVAAVCFADAGNDVACVERDGARVAMLERGELPIYEPGLGPMLQRNVREGRLSFGSEIARAVAGAEVVFLAVGTPENEDGTADLGQVLAAARELAPHLRAGALVVNKSTVPVGSADRVRAAIAALCNVPFEVVSNPEFLKEGAAVEDFLRPDRIVIGTESEPARVIMRELYEPFMRRAPRMLFMDTRSAELTKYAANAMLATRISFMNDLAVLCERVGADVEEVRHGIGSDGRIGDAFLYAGVGYGGSCFPKDLKALVATAKSHGVELDLLRAVERTNERQRRTLLARAARHFGDLHGIRAAIWGLSFKPNTDDMREAPAVELIEGLLGKGAEVTAFDPVASTAARRVFRERIRIAERPYDAVEGADALFVMTEWNEFRHPDFVRMRALMRRPVIFDGRNVYAPARLRALGFTHHGIGRGHAADSRPD